MRVLIAIGCNAYDHASVLNTAEKDAQRIFDALLKPEVGEYDAVASKLLLSPTLEEVRQALRVVLFSARNIESFTFFFAGHGGVSAGSFYMWVRDSTPSAQSMSALSLGDLFRSLNEAAPLQSNVIIDVCESGGLVSDLGILLKPELLGDSGSPALTLVATSAQNQSAMEDQNGGYGTNAILDCIEGRDFVNDSESILNLVDIGRRVSERLSDRGQNPIVWGLNLYGAPRFCRNPRYASDPSAPLRNLVQSWPAESDSSIKINYDLLWAAYSSAGGAWDVTSFMQVMRKVLDPAVIDTIALSSHAERLNTTFRLKSKESQDPFRGPQIAACIATCLLPAVGLNSMALSVERILHQCATDLLEANDVLIKSLQDYKYALLAAGGEGLSELYYLPIRISKVLGWSAICGLISLGGDQKNKAAEQFAILLKIILVSYSGCLVALSDSQAPFFCVVLSYAISLGLKDEAEQLVGHLFCSFIGCKGQLACSDLPPEKALAYLVARNSQDFTDNYELIEQPAQTLTVLLKAAKALDLEEVLDESLWELDGLSFSAYVSSDYFKFGLQVMEDGDNLIWSIGSDVFRTDDLISNWPPCPCPRPFNAFVAAISIMSSFVQPDRVPWFCLDAEFMVKASSEFG